MHCPVAGQDLLLINRMWSNTAKQWSLLIAVLMLLCSISIRWVQCALIFLTDSFPTADFDFTGLFNFCTSFFSLYCHACQSAVLIYIPFNSCHMIACATYIIANISKPTRMSKPAHLENFFDKP